MLRRPALLLLLLILGFAAAPAAHAAGIAFRYLAGKDALSSPHERTGVDVAPFVGTPEAAARSSWGLPATFAARFEAPASTMMSEGGEALRQALGPAITAEVWIRPASVEGDVTLITNRVADAGGFRLAMADGVPYAEIDIQGTTARLDATVGLSVDTDHWVAATFQRYGGTLRLRIYVDGRLAAYTDVEPSFTVVHEVARPFFIGTDAGGEAAEPELTGSFSGHLYAAVVRDYVAREEYLTSGLPKDGSLYMGLPAFLDKPLDEVFVPMDQKIAGSPTPVRHRIFLPFVNDNYVPQGTATATEVNGTDTTSLVYVSYYHMTREGRAETKQSVIAEIDVETGQMRRGFRLYGQIGRSHVGGIAYLKDAIFVSSRSVLERYPLPEYDPNAPRLLDLHADPDGTVSVASRASFVSAHNDTLWVGDWRPANTNAPFLYGYATDDDGRPVSGTTNTVYALPRNIQGVDFFEHNGTQYVAMVRNRNSSEAEVLRMTRSSLSPYRVPSADDVLTLPHGIEDVSFWPDGTLWTNSESGTDYYQNTANWSRFYPFVYSIAGHRLIPGIVDVSSEAGEAKKSGIRLGNYPNPFRGSTTITLAAADAGPRIITIVDVLGRTVATLANEPLPAGEHTFFWDGQGMAPGLYFAVVDGPEGRETRPMTLVK